MRTFSRVAGRPAMIIPAFGFVLTLCGAAAGADTFYECINSNGVAGYYNKKQPGQKCRVYMDFDSKKPAKPKGAKCIVQRYRNTVFYKCEKNGVWYVFNKMKPSGSSKKKGRAGQKSSRNGSSALRKVVSSDEITVMPGAARGAGRVEGLEGIVESAAKEFDIPPALLYAVIEVESGFNPDVVSPVGAQGLMQLMPVTADHLNVDNPFDPVQNVRAGAKLLRILSDRFEGDLELVMAAYYAGSENVRKSGNRVPASCEGYVSRVMKRYRKHHAAESRSDASR